MQQAALQQHFHQGLNTANLDQLGHQVLATGAQVGQYRYLLADAGKVVQGYAHADGRGHGDQMQHGIG